MGTAKPMLYLVNLSEKDFIRKKNKWLPKIKEYVDKNDPRAMIIPFSGSFEAKLLEMDEDGRKSLSRDTKLWDSNIFSRLDPMKSKLGQFRKEPRHRKPLEEFIPILKRVSSWPNV